MKIDLIAVGNETRYRNHFDAAYQFLGKEAASVNAEVVSYRILRAEPTELFGVLKSSMQQNDVVLLLAAPDPNSAQTILKVICSGLELGCTTDATLEKQVQQRATHLGLDFTYEQLAAFATFPKGSRMIANPIGLVQGYAITAKKQVLLVLPAVPSELSSVYSSEIRPMLAGLTGLSASYGMVRVLEIDEFSVEQEIKRLNENSRLHISCQQNNGDYEIYIEASGATQEAADQLKNAAVKHLRDRFGIYLYCIGNQPLPTIVVDLLSRNGLSLSSAEMGTDMAFQRQFSAAWGAGSIYRSYFSEEDIRGEMHLPHKLLQDGEGCSAALAATLASQSRKNGRTALGIGICSSPAGAASEDRSRLIVAISDKKKVWLKRLELPRSKTPEQIAQIAVWQALNMIRLYAAQYPTPLPGGTEIANLEKRTSGLPALFSHKKSVSTAQSNSTAKGAETGNIDVKEKDTMNLASSRNKKSGRRPTGSGAAAAAQGTNLIQRIKTHQLTKSDKIRMIALGACVLVFIACIIYIASVKMESVTNAQKSEELAGLYGSDANVEGYPSNYIKGFEALYGINPDIAGWITLPDTELNYAVVQGNNNEQYDRTDFYGKTNQHGIPFVDFRVDLEKPSFNTIIYSHNMGDGQMFGQLINYKKLSYYQSHPTVTFNSVYRENDYKIFAVVVCKANDNEFSYHNFVDSSDPSAIDTYLGKILERSIIKTTVDVKNTDKLLTLSTCDYSFRDPDTNKLIARFVIFARAVRPGESTTVNTDGATLNSNPVMPKEWFDYIKKQQDKKEAEALEKEQKAYIDLWLTASEKTGTVAEQYAKAQDRATKAEQYLSSAELGSGMTPDKILETINYRQKLFTLLVSDSEASLSANNKLTLCEERTTVLNKFFTDDELWKIGKWSVLEERYNVISSDANILRYLSTAEIKDTTQSASTQLSLVASRKADASRYLTDDQINSCQNWAELDQKIATAKTTRKTLEEQALKAGYTQAEIDKMSLSELKAAVDKKLNEAKLKEVITKIQALNPNATGTNGKALAEMSLDELNALLATLQSERTSLEAAAKKYGMSDADIAKLSNTALSQAITKQKTTYDSLISKILADYPDKITQAELEKLSYAELLAKQTALSKDPVKPPEGDNTTPTDISSGGDTGESAGTE